MMETKTFTVAELADAIEKNGVEQTFGHFFSHEDQAFNNPDLYIGEAITAACALGQASLNLGVSTTPTWRTITRESTWEQGAVTRITNSILTWNDSQRLSFKEIADRIRLNFADELNLVIEAPTHEYTVTPQV